MSVRFAPIRLSAWACRYRATAASHASPASSVRATASAHDAGSDGLRDSLVCAQEGRAGQMDRVASGVDPRGAGGAGLRADRQMHQPVKALCRSPNAGLLSSVPSGVGVGGGRACSPEEEKVGDLDVFDISGEGPLDQGDGIGWAAKCEEVLGQPRRPFKAGF